MTTLLIGTLAGFVIGDSHLLRALGRNLRAAIRRRRERRAPVVLDLTWVEFNKPEFKKPTLSRRREVVR